MEREKDIIQINIDMTTGLIRKATNNLPQHVNGLVDVAQDVGNEVINHLCAQGWWVEDNVTRVGKTTHFTYTLSRETDTRSAAQYAYDKLESLYDDMEDDWQECYHAKSRIERILAELDTRLHTEKPAAEQPDTMTNAELEYRRNQQRVLEDKVVRLEAERDNARELLHIATAALENAVTDMETTVRITQDQQRAIEKRIHGAVIEIRDSECKAKSMPTDEQLAQEDYVTPGSAWDLNLSIERKRRHERTEANLQTAVDALEAIESEYDPILDDDFGYAREYIASIREKARHALDKIKGDHS